MSRLDSLRAATRQHRGTAEPPEHWPPPGATAAEPATPSNAGAEATPAVDPAYLDFWINSLQELQGLPPDRALARFETVVKQGPWQPPVTDALLFQAAAVHAELITATVAWLRMRAVLHDDGVLPCQTAQFWLRGLEQPAAGAGTEWLARCQRVAASAEAQGLDLPVPIRRAVQDHPEWALGYLLCAGYKDVLVHGPRHLMADRPLGTPAAAEDSRTPAAADRPPMSSAATMPLAPFQPALGSGVPLAAGTRVGAGMGAVVGGVVNTVTTAAAVAMDTFKQHARTRTTNHALDALTQAADALRQHPPLRAFWGRVDAQAAQAGHQQRTRVFIDMGQDPAHPLNEAWAQLQREDPQVRAWMAQARHAFQRLGTTWATAPSTTRQASSPWRPTAEQIQRLRTACQAFPPDADRSVWTAVAEQLIRPFVQGFQAVRDSVRARGSTSTTHAAAPPPRS